MLYKECVQSCVRKLVFPDGRPNSHPNEESAEYLFTLIANVNRLEIQMPSKVKPFKLSLLGPYKLRLKELLGDSKVSFRIRYLIDATLVMRSNIFKISYLHEINSSFDNIKSKAQELGDLFSSLLPNFIGEGCVFHVTFLR